MIESILFSVLKNSFIVSAVALLFLFLRPFILKKRTAKWMYFLFLVLFIRLAVPIDLTVANSVFVINIPEIVLSTGNASEEFPPVSGNIDTVPPVEDITPTPDTDVTVPVAPTPSVPTPPKIEPSIPGNISGTVTETPGTDIGNLPAEPTPPTVDPIVPDEPAVSEPTPEPISFSISLFDALGIVYGLGILAFALYQTVCYNVMIHSLKNSSIPCADKEILKISEKVCDELKIKRPLPVRISSAVSTPTLAGLVRPMILFPKNCKDENYLGYIFRHEYMHYKYGDLYFKLFALIANAVHWFNPVIYILRREAEKVVEFVCDRRVIESYNGMYRSEYCNAILDEVERAILERKKRTSYMTTAFTGNKKTLKERLSSILDTEKKRRGVISFVAIVLLVALAGIIVSCNVQPAVKEPDDVDYKTPIPENVVIDPVFEYVAVDPEAYNPHITTGDGELIDKLYSYVHKPYASEYAELVYRAEKTTVENIDSYLMLMTVFNTFGVEGLETGKIYNYNNSEEYIEYLIYPQKLMDERLKIIYGEDVKIEHGSFYPRDGVNAEYIAEEHYYRVYPYDLDWNGRWEDFCNHYEYLRSEEKGKYIYIYENYYSTAYDYDDPCGPTACSGDFSTEFSLENGILPEYKHTFQKDKNGVFHWVSTEIVTDLDTILLPEADGNLSEDEKLAKDLYSYILKDGSDVVYRNGVTTVENVSMSNMQELIHRIYGTRGLKRIMRNSVDNWQYYLDYWGDNVLFVLPEELMEERIREVFGQNAKIVHQSYELYNSSVFGQYSPEDKCYYLGVFSGLGEDLGDPSNSYYLGYENKGNEFIIYDKYVYTPRSPYIASIYRDCEMKDLVSAVSLRDDDIELPDGTDGNPVSAYYDHATVYKHTFKKASDGSYYWYSTEQATPENGISEAAGEEYVYSDSQKAYELGLKLWNDFDLGEDDEFEYATSCEFLSPDGLGSVNYNISNHIKENTDYIVFGIGGAPNKYGTQYAVAYYFAEENGKYSLLLTDTGAYCGIPEYIYSYDDYLAYVGGDESKFEALAYLFRKYMIGLDQQPSYALGNGPAKWDAYVSSSMVQRCNYFVSRNITYACYSQFDSLYGSNEAYLTLIGNGGFNYSSDFLIISDNLFLGSVYTDDIVVDIIPREWDSSLYEKTVDVVFGNGDYCVFALNSENIRLISMTSKSTILAPEPTDLSLTSDTRLFIEELFYKNSADFKILSINNFFTYELDSVVKSEYGNGYKYEVYCHLYENILYDEAYVKCTFGKISDYYYLMDVSVSDGPNGEKEQLKTSSGEKDEEPIPENVVMKPEVEYSTDTSNYTPHIDTGKGDLINELYSYILKPYYTPYMELVYRNEKVTAATLEDHIKQMTVFAVFGIEGLEVRSEMCAYGYEVDFTIYPATLMEERAKIIYGDDVKIDHFTFYPLYYNTVEYIEDGHYYRFNADLFEHQWPTRKLNHTQFLRYEEQGDYIYIYDSYYSTEEFNIGYISSSNNIYASSLGRGLVAEFVNDNGKKYRQRDPETGEIVLLDDFAAVVPEYKHTFKKDSDGEYHWVSTEPITDINSLVIEPKTSDDNDLNIATELYNYVIKYDYYGSELVYRKGTTKASDLSDYMKRLAVFKNFGFNGLDIVMSGLVWQDSDLARVKIVYPEELMEERVRKIFGDDATVQHGSGTWADGITVEYSSKDRCYYISAFDGGGDSPNENFIYYLRHENKGDEFIIYDKYVFVDSYNGSHYLYRASKGEDFITTLKTEDFEGYATVYKHTFKKASDGSYYWYSTEQANENNGISDEVGLDLVLSDEQKTIKGVGRILFEKYFNDEDYLLTACISLENVFPHTPTMDESDYVIFVSGAQSADQVEALYFSENNGSYELVYRDRAVKHHYPTYGSGKALFEWYLQHPVETEKRPLIAMTEEVLEEYPQVVNINRDPLAQFQYLTSNIVYRCDTYESDGVLYVNFEDMNNLGILPKKSVMDGITWDYSSGYVVLAKGSPAENTYKDVEIRYLEPMHGYYADVLFVTGTGEKYHATVLYEEDSVTVNGIHPFYDNFVITPDDLADPEMKKTFANELIDTFELDSYVSGFLTGGHTYELMTEAYENGGLYYQLYFSANESGVNMFDYVYVKIAKVGDGYYLYGYSRVSSLPTE